MFTTAREYRVWIKGSLKGINLAGEFNRLKIDE